MNAKLIAGNWKMNGRAAQLEDAVRMAESGRAAACDMLICPPFTLISRMADRLAGTSVQVGGQDCHSGEAGACTGDCSAEMLADAGASHVILGHSERRQNHGETAELIGAKLKAARRASLTAIFCVGETLAEREAGRALAAVEAQLAASLDGTERAADLIIAYEPVWAIGTGRTPTRDQIGEIHADIRRQCVARYGDSQGAAMRILYGGSMKPGNAAEILAIPEVDGGLIGGASLKPEDFGAIIAAASRQA